MPFIPHTLDDEASMLAAIGIKHTSELFDEIPTSLMIQSLPGIPQGLTEMEMAQLMNKRAANMKGGKCFIGAGAYEHHIPAAVWDITTRGEFLTAYTPYQAEASQGTLQLLWEYQTMMASLMGLAVSNASLYDGATALAEAALMGIRLQKKVTKPCVWVPQTVHPFYRQVLVTLLKEQNIEVIEIPFEREGVISIATLNAMRNKQPNCTVLIVPQPNFFGRLEKVNELTDWGHAHGAIVVGLVNPMAMSLLKPPGQWGEKGADIACGEGQALGVPLAGGGPYFGFLCTRMEFVRQLPGRLVGRTLDKEGKQGFTLTLQAREQHIRRSKATSNICTNQGLLVTAGTIYMSIMGPKGLQQVAQTCYQRMQLLIKLLQEIPEVSISFVGEHFHEVVIELSVNVNDALNLMKQKGIAAGFALEEYYPALKNALLICTTETKTEEDIFEYVLMLKETVAALQKHIQTA
jgi:glycine dehydrogenase subunit 1